MESITKNETINSNFDSKSTFTLPETIFSKKTDFILKTFGNAFSWVWIALMSIIILNVFMRYALGEGRIEFEELQWHLYAAGWLVGLSYCFTFDEHVRVDLLHDRLKLRTQAWIELFGIFLLLIPFIITVIWFSIPFISYSLELNEVSSAPGGLPYRWIIKSCMLIGFVLLALAVLSRLSRVITLLFIRKEADIKNRNEEVRRDHGNQ